MQKEELKSTREQIKRFKESFLWQDMMKEIEGWREGFERTNSVMVENITRNNLTSASVIVTMGELSGISKAVDRMLFIPDVFLSLLGDDEEEGEEDGT